MSFDLQTEKRNNSRRSDLIDLQQMTFEDYAKNIQSKPVASSSQVRVSRNATAINFDSLVYFPEPEPSKTPRFLTFSVVLHVAALLAVAMITVPIVEQANTETITVDIEEVAVPRKVSKGVQVPATQGGTPVTPIKPIVEKLDSAGSPDDIIVSKPTPKAAVEKPTIKAVKPAKAAKASVPARQALQQTGHGQSAKTASKAVPLTIDDIEAPELDQGELAKATVASNLNEDYDDDFSKVEQHSQRSIVDKEKDSLNALAAAVEQEQTESLEALNEENREEEKKLAALQNSVRQKNSKAIAAALAADEAAALARQQAAEKAAKNSGLGGDQSGSGMKSGVGSGNSGAQNESSPLSGLPSGIRSLDQLRQMPGNPRPQYDPEERLRGHQGQIAFIAYISKEGYPSKFRMLKSTGFRNLDAKTLSALKKWRFYPGQEGWVELPFVWNLKGDVQQAGGLLRTGHSRH